MKFVKKEWIAFDNRNDAFVLVEMTKNEVTLRCKQVEGFIVTMTREEFAENYWFDVPFKYIVQ